MSQNQLPANAAQQPLFAHQLWTLMEQQVKGYHKQYHMGENSSVSQETARELMSSVQFTLSLVPQQADLNATLALGQAVLEAKTEEVKKLWALVSATVPDIDDDYLPKTVAAIGNFLKKYDFRFFAHRTADWEYPLFQPVEEGLRGIFYTEAFLQHLWLENQILAVLDGDEVSQLLEAQIPDHWSIPLNLCEQPLINALGRVLLGLPVPPITLRDTDVRQLTFLLRGQPLEAAIEQAIALLAQELRLNNPSALAYLNTLSRLLLPRLNAALPKGDLSRIFISAI